ncbi:MAG: hypothetical protein ACYDAG_08825 [Chloroflexota bacterium]
MATEAIAWLEEARAQEDDAAGEVRAALARMYGVTRQYQAMLDQITRTMESRLVLRSQLQTPETLAHFSIAVDGELDQEAALVRLNRLLDRPEQVTAAAFVRSVADAPKDGIHWLAIARGEYWTGQAERPDSPLQLLVFVEDKDGKPQARAAWFPRQRGSPRTGFPADGQVYVPANDLFQDVEKRFLLVCPSGPIA